MDPASILQFIILLLLVFASGFFSSAETALTTVNRIQIQLLADTGDKRAPKVLAILDNSPKMLSAILIGNNIVNLSASALATSLTIRIFGSGYVGLVTGLLTFLILIFGEIMPKSLATIYSKDISLWYASVIQALMVILTPVIFIVEGMRSLILKIMGIDPDAKVDTMTEDELKSLVDVSHKEGAIEEDEFEMINNVFDLDDSLARDIMIPKTDMVLLQADTTYEDFLKIYKKCTFTRYPVYDKSTDTIIGTFHIKDLIGRAADDFDVRGMMREPHFTFEHKEIGTLLMEMREDAVSLVIVLDEYGSVSGMITLEDLLEEIVGEIRDEFDSNETDAIVKCNDPYAYRIEGHTNLDDINDKLGTNLKSEEYDSIGGFLIEYLDRLPKSGESVTLEDGTQIIAELVKKNRIEMVKLILPHDHE